MTQEEVLQAKYLLKERVESLKNDSLLCSQDLNLDGKKIQNAPFPILMYAFATIDYFSSLWAGWNKPGKDKDQTKRMTDFLVKFFNYPKKSAKIGIHIFRHKLMHTAQPRIITAKNKKERYYWYIDFEFNKKHFIPVKADPDPNDPDYDHYEFWISISQLIADIEEGIFGPRGYFNDLVLNRDNSQNKFQACIEEFKNYKVEI